MKVRALSPGDAAAARAAVVAQFGGTRYVARMLEVLDAAVQGAEHRGLVAGEADAVDALLLYCEVAGADRVARIDCLAGDAGAARVLVSALSSPRLVVAELPGDEPFAPMAAALAEQGFRTEGEVPDFFADGVALRLFTRGAS